MVKGFSFVMTLLKKQWLGNQPCIEFGLIQIHFSHPTKVHLYLIYSSEVLCSYLYHAPLSKGKRAGK